MGLFWINRLFLKNLGYSYILSFLLYWMGFQINSSLLNPAESCSNLKSCLNKICTLPAASCSSVPAVLDVVKKVTVSDGPEQHTATVLWVL